MKNLRFWAATHIVVSTALVGLSGIWTTNVAQATIATLAMLSFMAAIAMIGFRKLARNETEARNRFTRIQQSIDVMNKATSSIDSRHSKIDLQIVAIGEIQQRTLTDLQHLAGRQHGMQQQIEKLEQLVSQAAAAQVTEIMTVVDKMDKAHVKSLGVLGRQMQSIDTRTAKLSADLRETNARIASVSSLMTDVTLRVVMSHQSTGDVGPETERQRHDQ